MYWLYVFVKKYSVRFIRYGIYELVIFSYNNIIPRAFSYRLASYRYMKKPPEY